jgi:hypothetical protein
MSDDRVGAIPMTPSIAFSVMSVLLMPVLLAMVAGGGGIASATERPEPTSHDWRARTFVGSSPCGTSIRPMLGIDVDAACDLIEWKLVLRRDRAGTATGAYDLRVEYGTTRQGHPGLGPEARESQRRGAWRSRGTDWLSGRSRQANADAYTFELEDGPRFVAVGDQLLHVLDDDGGLMVGNGGWSYTLNSAERAETSSSWRFLLSQPERSYPIAALATGPTVFGVFEGRSPCQGIARQLGIAVESGCQKVKWRVTLFQDSATHEPTRYKIESSLQLEAAREGDWSIVREPRGPGSLAYRLEPAAGEQPVVLLRGDDNVLFILDERLRPRIGHAGFSYTLNRRLNAALTQVRRTHPL